MTDPLLTPNERRYVLFPIRDRAIWQAYKRLVASTWSADEVKLEADVRDWRDRLSPPERDFISRVLAFFAAADGIVGENLAVRFYGEVQLPEARAFYAAQIANEQVHAEMYSLLIDTLLVDEPAQRDALFDAMARVPSIAAKARWSMRWLDSREASFGERLVAFACVEGIFFSSSFCALFWLKKRNLMPGVTLSNEWISRDEASHQDFACMLLDRLQPENRPSPERILEIVRDAVEVECAFVEDALRVDLIGINAASMCAYVRFVADRLLQQMGATAEPHYGARNPFEWMELMAVERKTNFFERTVSDYTRWEMVHQASGGVGGATSITTEGDF